FTTGRLGFGQIKQPNRDVAQPGSALAWGARGREFESRHPDPVKSRPQSNLGPCCFLPVQTWFKHFDHFLDQNCPMTDFRWVPHFHRRKFSFERWFSDLWTFKTLKKS
ncbi:MAG: hypothetical protein RL737_2080, partial [Bacteroidota bacterium]